ncbi:MAG: DUF3047 domain-containing protein [Nitrospirota bacterium]
MATDHRPSPGPMAVLAMLVVLFVIPSAEAQRAAGRIVLSGFAAFPEGWTAQGEFRPADLYRVVTEDDGPYLRAAERSGGARIFKKTAWDSAAYPIIEWRWRVTKWPSNAAAQVSLYVSLDTDIFGIPTILKYTWSRSTPEGTVTEGGFFRPIDIVVQSGAVDQPNEWIAERIDARADFERLIGRAPKGAAYGIGLLADPGVVVEIGEITAGVRSGQSIP